MLIIPHEILYISVVSFVVGFVIATMFNTTKGFGFLKAFLYGEFISAIVVSCVYFLVLHMNEISGLFLTSVKVV